MSVTVDNGNKKNTLWVMYEEQSKIIEHHTGVPASIILIGLGVCCAFVLIGILEVYITNIVGILYPAYCSIKAIESVGADDDKQWLTYWVVFGLFSILDLFSGFILRFIPFYFFVKLIFLIWLFMPNMKGATFVYDKFLIKYFKKYESEMDRLVNEVDGSLGNAVKGGKDYIKDNQGSIIAGGFKVAQAVKKLE